MSQATAGQDCLRGGKTYLGCGEHPWDAPVEHLWVNSNYLASGELAGAHSNVAGPVTRLSLLALSEMRDQSLGTLTLVMKSSSVHASRAPSLGGTRETPPEP